MNILYHLPFSGDCRLVRIALAEKKINFKLLVEPIWKRRKIFLSHNPDGNVQSGEFSSAGLSFF